MPVKVIMQEIVTDSILKPPRDYAEDPIESRTSHYEATEKHNESELGESAKEREKRLKRERKEAERQARSLVAEEELKEKEGWFGVLSAFTPVIRSDFAFLQALTIEHRASLRKFYTSKYSLIRSPFQDRFDFLANVDVESTTELMDLWRK
jgi:hypothetical protein